MITIALSCGLPEKTAAQTRVMSLDECLQTGLENNLQFQVEQLKVLRAEKTKRSTLSRFLPQVGGSASHNYYFGSTIDPASNARIESNIQSNNFGLEAFVNLFNFSELWESKLLADDHLIAIHNKALVEKEFELILIQKYYDALAAQEWKKVIEEQLKNSEEQLDRIKHEVADGAKPESDVYDIQVIYTQEKKMLQQTQQEEQNHKLALIQLMNINNLKPDDLLCHAEASSGHAETPTGHAERSRSISNLVNHPSLKLVEIQNQRLHHEYKQLLGPMLPKLGLSYSYGTFYSNKIQDIFDTSLQFGNQLRNNKNQFLGLNLSVPIFSRGDRMRSRTLKQIEIQENQAQLNKTRQDLENQFSLEQQKHKQFADLEPVLSEHLELANKSLETTKSKFEFGRVDISAYKAAKNQVLSANYELLKNRFFKDMSQEVMESLLK